MTNEYEIFKQMKERLKKQIVDLENRKEELYYIFEKGKYLSKNSILSEMERVNESIENCLQEIKELDVIEFSFLKNKIVNLFFTLPKEWCNKGNENFRIEMYEDKWGKLILIMDEDNVRAMPTNKNLNIIQINVLQKYLLENLNLEIFGGRLVKKIINFKNVNEIKS